MGASGLPDCELIKAEALTTSLLNACAGLCCEPESTNAHLGNLEQARIVGDCGNNDSSRVVLVQHLSSQSADAHAWPVHPALQQAPQDFIVEVRASPACKELVELNENAIVRIDAPGELAPALLLVVVIALIQTHLGTSGCGDAEREQMIYFIRLILFSHLFNFFFTHDFLLMPPRHIMTSQLVDICINGNENKTQTQHNKKPKANHLLSSAARNEHSSH